jgi:hypothetical protein
MVKNLEYILLPYIPIFFVLENLNALIQDAGLTGVWMCGSKNDFSNVYA